MIEQLRLKNRDSNQSAKIFIVIFVIVGAAILGLLASSFMLFAVGAAIGGVLLLRQPFIGLIYLIFIALLFPFEIGTGTEVSLNLSVLFIPALFLVWILYKMTSRNIELVISKSFIPLVAFLALGLLALMIGNVLWDPLVPKSDNFIVVQMAQWAIFFLSGLIFFLVANLVDNEKTLRYLVLGFLAIGGLLAITSVFIGTNALIESVATIAIIRTPFWILLSGIAGGQLLFNQRLSRPWRFLAILSLVAVFLYAFIQQREAVSNWVGITIVGAVLVWLRWPRLRIPALIFTMLLILTGILTQTLWEFGGGDAEWTTSGSSRIALASRVIDVTMSNPITGLGPAAYRNYAAMTPLTYGRANWIDPSVNAHNNYVDIFSQTGLIGLGFFLWFMVSLLLIIWRLSQRYQSGFLGGYTNGMISVWAAIMVTMMLLDWFLPFVYNVGFPGFQASVLVWMFFGAIIAVDWWGGGRNGEQEPVVP